MGFLDHTTNNIIVDAVLTDEGRAKLASANGLKIIQYAFADTEVDYTLLAKYGEIVGKEKIEKNTPIFEANTAQSSDLYHNLLQDSSGNTVETLVAGTPSGPNGSDEYTIQITPTNFTGNQNTLYFTLIYNTTHLSFQNGGALGSPNVTRPVGDSGGALEEVVFNAYNNTNAFTLTFKDKDPTGGSRQSSFQLSEYQGASTGTVSITLNP